MGHPSPRPAPLPEPPSSSGLRVKDLRPPSPFFLGRYLVVDEIGQGGMASVHLGRMDGPGGFQKWAAIKRIHPHLAENERFVDMFLDEARTAASISHANVAQVFDIGRDEDTYWLAMEYLHGEPLREVIRRLGVHRMRIGMSLAARICADAALGLHAAHELRGKNGQLLGVVHRDVSPHNLFITYDGRTRVVDFGIAKSADRLAEETGAGVLKGKIAYVSPEQVKLLPVDRRTDVFALGVVLWEMTTGRRLFRADTDFETLTNVMDCVVPRPSAVAPGYPPELEACVLKALARRPEDRYATARDFSRDLERYLVQSGDFAGVDEVAELMQGLFADRMRAREAHLAWAAELDAPAGSAEPVSMVDDEDAPTIVATYPTRAVEQRVDLGATVALPVGFGPSPSPTFGQYVQQAPPPPMMAPPRAIPAVPVQRFDLVPAAPRSARLRAVIVCLVLLAALAAGVLAAIAAHGWRSSQATMAPPIASGTSSGA